MAGLGQTEGELLRYAHVVRSAEVAAADVFARLMNEAA